MQQPVVLDPLPDEDEFAFIGHGAAIETKLVETFLPGGVAQDLDFQGRELEALGVKQAAAAAWSAVVTRPDRRSSVSGS